MWKPAYNLTRAAQRPLSSGRKTRMRNYWRQQAERNVLAGLTTRGTVRKRRQESRLILADVDALAIALAECFHDLPPKVQARVLMLEIKLSAARKQLL